MTRKPSTTLTVAGAELRAAREAAELSQQAISDLFGWNRDATSKLEAGSLNISLKDYLTLCQFMREFMDPDHPALALYTRLNRSRRTKGDS
jgi:transcriptional regulator with XRE-family HTH domain